ncbi:MAG: flagellar hook-basal body complex protein [Candidatus Pacebacteria bacterium]|nr:flagellar hook-basal body complex protein [Candidatus Paceibacterota bacterium]
MVGLHGAFNNALMGVQTQSQKFGVIADNIANASTVGYKKTTANFGDMVGTYRKPSYQIGGGVGMDVRQSISMGGSLQLSNNSSNLALSGKGMFAVTSLTANNGTTVSPLGSYAVTRKGDFSPNKDGNLVNSAGFTLLGVAIPTAIKVGTVRKPPTDLISAAVINSAANAKASLNDGTPLDGGGLVPVTVPADALIAASRTSNVYIGVNLPSETAPGGAAPADLFTDKIAVIGADGVDKLIDVSYRRLATATPDGRGGTWEASFSGAGVTPTTVTINFNSSGYAISPAQGVVTVDGQAVTMHYDGYNSEAVVPASTMFDGQYSSIGTFNDGRPQGMSVGYSIDEVGVVTQIFSNGISIPRFQIPIADCINIDGLEAISGNAFIASQTSGAITVSLSSAGLTRSAFSDGSGSETTMAQGIIEASNVDIAEEFTEMIKTQNAYASNAKVLTTLNEMEGVNSRLGQ